MVEALKMPSKFTPQLSSFLCPSVRKFDSAKRRKQRHVATVPAMTHQKILEFSKEWCAPPAWQEIWAKESPTCPTLQATQTRSPLTSKRRLRPKKNERPEVTKAPGASESSTLNDVHSNHSALTKDCSLKI